MTYPRSRRRRRSQRRTALVTAPLLAIGLGGIATPALAGALGGADDPAVRRAPGGFPEADIADAFTNTKAGGRVDSSSRP